MDAQSVKNSAREKGYDEGKKVSGIKCHIAVDTQGLPHAIAVTRANVKALAHSQKSLNRVQVVLADGVYRGVPFAQVIRETVKAVMLGFLRHPNLRFLAIFVGWGEGFN